MDTVHHQSQHYGNTKYCIKKEDKYEEEKICFSIALEVEITPLPCLYMYKLLEKHEG